MRILFCIIILGFSVKHVIAAGKTFVFHINGINTTRIDAENNTRSLEMAVREKSKILSHKGHFELLYNRERNTTFCGLCNQLIDVLHQKRYEGITVDDYVAAYIKEHKLNYAVGTMEYNRLKYNIKQKYFSDPVFMGANFAEMAEQFHHKVELSNQHNHKNLHEFVQASLNDNDSKPHILLIPHSQGNLYANKLYEKLTQMEGYDDLHLNIFGIATPAEKSLGNWISKNIFYKDGYITSSNDVIINALRVFASISPQQKILPPNIEIPSGHSLVATYLANETSKNQIIDMISGILHYYQGAMLGTNFSKSLHKNNKNSVEI